MAKDYSRRELFSLFRRRPDPAPAPAPPEAAAPTPDPLRPPGAVFDALLVDKCSRCGKCVDACPREAIFPLDASFGRAAGTPAIIARQAPCVVCEGLQCTAVCPTHVLAKVAVFDVQMGTAVVAPPRCLTFQGEPCSTCVEACPVPGALTADAGGHPMVDELRCIGCGVCEHVCPTAVASIVVAPARPIAR